MEDCHLIPVHKYTYILLCMSKSRDLAGHLHPRIIRKHTTTHEVSLKSNHSNYKGCPCNVMIDRETGESSREPLSLIAADNPVTYEIYAKNKIY